MSQNFAPANKPKVRNFAFDCQNERPLIYVDREAFTKTPQEYMEIYNFKKELGKTKHHKFQTQGIFQF